MDGKLLAKARGLVNGEGRDDTGLEQGAAVAARLDGELAIVEQKLAGYREGHYQAMFADAPPTSTERAGSPDAGAWGQLETELLEVLSHPFKLVRGFTALMEAWTFIYGWAGLAAGASAYREVLERTRDKCWPADVTERHQTFFTATKVRKIKRRDEVVLLDGWNIPLLSVGGRPMALFDIRAVESKARSSPSSEELERARADTGEAALQAWRDGVAAVRGELQRLSAAIRLDFGLAGGASTEVDASFSRLDSAIAARVGQAEAWVKRAKSGGMEQAGGGTAAGAGAGAAAQSPVADRAQALQYIDAAARYFESADPHSPVIHRLRTAQRWITKPVTAILKDLLESDSERTIVTKALGLDPSVDAARVAADSKVEAPAPPPAAAPAGTTSVQGSVTAEGAAGVDATGPAPSAAKPEPATTGPTATSRAEALRLIEAAATYISTVERHSMAKFPLAFAAKLVNMPLQDVIQTAITSESARDALLKELGVPFLQPPKKES